MSLAAQTNVASCQINCYGAVHSPGLFLLDDLHQMHLTTQPGFACHNVDLSGLSGLGPAHGNNGGTNRGATVEEGHGAVTVLEVAEIGALDRELGHQPHVEGRCGGGVDRAHALDRDLHRTGLSGF
ncbi:hypothetical protein Acr_18g0008420 [Actinidia rufa]|uniref:Uncharacterized protein n=1 Tax=Actinidia rufa TaxID=165716 RepID=A0A7J0G7H9_9ERIC|nr:hypothetical protein Acr_18g0008420 [Actinidia rufa]